MANWTKRRSIFTAYVPLAAFSRAYVLVFFQILRTNEADKPRATAAQA
jgi:hypothetical protein